MELSSLHVSQDHAESLAASSGSSSLQDAVQRWAWSGMGADSPTAVPGLSGVRGIALGSLHAVALVA